MIGAVDFLSPLEPGDRLGPYTIVRRLGEGGMGVVYEARNDHGRRVALKVLADWLVSEIGRQRFEREVQACAQLTHHNIVAIYDYGQSEDGTLFYAMEYLDGVDLGRLVDLDGPQPAPRTIRILHQIAGALGVAHDNGLLHRDIKPPNILLCASGGVPDVAKLVDFGLVVPLSGSTRISLDGPVIGTPRYVAPEMLKDDGALSPASDFYALGLVAHFLLTGRHAFDGKSSAEILRKQRDEIPPSLADRGVAPDLSSVIAWCLEKSPEARPRAANALREALARCADAQRWDEDDASSWWVRWRAEHPKETITTPPPGGDPRSGEITPDN
jgi:serine/threonine protein kinase